MFLKRKNRWPSLRCLIIRLESKYIQKTLPQREGFFYAETQDRTVDTAIFSHTFVLYCFLVHVVVVVIGYSIYGGNINVLYLGFLAIVQSWILSMDTNNT
jgi:hypothetical protein